MSSNTERSRGAVGRFSRFGAAAIAAATVLSGLVVATSPGAPALAASITVNDVGDGDDVAPGNSVCETAVGNGVCTLRAAIQEANALAGADTITFNIAAVAPAVINVPTPLPAITSQISVDGYSQPGSLVNSLGNGTNAVYGVELVGLVSPGAAGLHLGIGAANSTVVGVYVRNFDIGIRVQAGAAANVVVSGNAASNCNVGIQVVGTSGVRVGGGALADRNHVFGTGYGVDVRASSFTGVRGNLLGTDRTGTARQANNYGIRVADGSTYTVIGGSTANDRNVVSGNFYSGILVQALPGDSADINTTNILGNYIGVDPTGNTPLGNGAYGIEVQGDTHLALGTNIGDGTVNGRNIISGNGSDGISIWGDSFGGLIRGNYIGVGADGVTALGNDLASGTDLGTVPGGGIVVRNYASSFTVGGLGAGQGNLIANNLRGIIFYSGSGNRILGNSIHSNVGPGIELGGVGANDAGDTDGGFANNGQNYPTVLPWLDGPGLRVEYSIDSIDGYSAYPITIDFFEADSAVSGEGKVFLGRDFATSPDEPMSVNLGNASALGVAAGDPVVAVATDANGNSSTFSPVALVGTPLVVNSTGNGVDLDPGNGLCDAVDGCTLRAAIQESNAHGGADVIGFGLAGAGVQVLAPSGALPAITDRVVIDGYGQSGAARNTSPTAFDDQLAVVLSGTNALGNPGLSFGAASSGSVVRGLQVSSYLTGIEVQGAAVGITGNRISGNVVGVLLTGATGSRVGGVKDEQRNLISGNLSTGVILRNSNFNFVQNNLIGTTAAGTGAFGNVTGVSLEQGSSNNLIGGLSAGSRNVVSGNSSQGISIQASASDSASISQNSIYGNYIGTDVTGNAALGNAGYGIWLAGGGANVVQFTTIGAETPASRNVIAGNGADGIEIRQNVNVTDVYGNYIGLAADGTTVLGNGVPGSGSMGISVSDLGPTNTINGTVIGYIGPPTGFGNVITGSDIGVGVSGSAADVRIRGNSIYGNAQYGIRLFSTPGNDPGDADTGANNLQNHPTFTLSVVAGSVAADVTLDSTALDTQYPVQVELYETDGVTNQGKRYVATGSVLAPGTASIDFGTASLLGIAPGDIVVMTATDANGNTSEFSQPVTVGPLPGTVTFIPIGAFADFNDPANWDAGHVPGPLETAVIPAGRDVNVTANTSIGALVLGGTLRTAGPVTLDVTGVSQVQPGAVLFVEATGTLALHDDLTVDGQMVVRPNALVTASGAGVQIGGGGLVGHAGILRAVGAGTDLTIGAGITWNSGGALEAVDGPITVSTPSWTDFDGRYAASAGRDITFDLGLALSPNAVVELGISGAASDPTKYGQLHVGGALTRNGTIRSVISGYTPTTTDVYPVITCGDCFGGGWTGYDTQPLEPVTSQFGISLRVVPGKVRSDSTGLEGFGTSVDVDGDWAVVGETNGAVTPLNRVAVYHYNSATSAWDLFQTIQGSAGFAFGADVAIDGDFVAVTNRGPGIDDDFTSIFRRSAAGQPFTPYMIPNPAFPGSSSDPTIQATIPGGGSVDIDGGVFAVGDPENRTPDQFQVLIPTAYLYKAQSGFLNLQQILWPSGTQAPQFITTYGSSISLWYDPNTDNGTVAVGAPEPDATAGRVYVFVRGNQPTWNPDPVEVLSETDLGADGSDTLDQYGWSVAVTPDFLAVGHRLYDDTLHDQGAVWVYGGTPGVYGNNAALLTASDADVANVFGTSVALEGNRLVVGAPGAQKFNEPLRDGAAYLFENNNDNWAQAAANRAPDGQAFDFYGNAVAMSGSKWLVGAPGDANDNGLDAGAFYAYDTAPVAPPGLTFDLGVATGSPSTVSVAPAGLAVTLFDRSVAAARTASNVAASSITTIGVEDTGIAAVTLQSIPLRSVVLSSAPLRSVPLVDIDITEGGGWPALLAGTDLANVPLANLTFGDALTDPVVDQRVEALPLRSVNVNGTPLRSVPLAAIALGETPLRSVPLRSVAPGEPDPWCAIIAPLLAESGESCDVALGHLNLLEVSLRGVSLDAAPLRSVPLRSVDMSVSPLRSVPLRSVDLDASPLRSVPLRSVPLRSVPLRSVQVGGTTLADIPLRSVPLRSVPLRSVPLRSVMVGNTALADVAVDSTPLRSVLIEGLSVDGAPLRSVPLRSVPLRSVDLAGSPLRSVPLRSVALGSVPLRSVELYPSPLRSVPLRSVDIQGSALAGIPLRSVNLATSPLRSVPLRSVPLSAVPLRSVPLRSVDIVVSPLRSVPLRSVPLRSVDLLSSPLRSVPLRSVVLLGVPVDCGKVSCDVATLGDAYAAGAISGDTTLGAILAATGDISLGELAPYFTEFGAAEISAALALGGFTLGDLTSLDGITFGDLASNIDAFGNMTLGDLGAALATVTYGDLVGHATNPVTGRPYTAGELQAELDGTTLTIADLLDVGNLTMGDLLDAANGATIADLGSLLDLIPVESLGAALAQQVLAYLSDTGHPTLTLGDLSPEQFGRLTLGDIAALMPDVLLGELLTALGTVNGVLDSYTLDDLLLALVDPSSLAQSPLPLSKVNVAELPSGAVGATDFQASFELSGGATRRVAIEVALPGAATYIAGSASVGGIAAEPVVAGNTLTWNFTAVPDVPYGLRFGVLPTLRLGSTSLDAVARVVGTDIIVPSSATVTVSEGIEPNDFLPATGGGRQTTPASEDSIYLTYISTPTDIDVFQIDLAQNDRLVAQLSNLSADLDVYLWRRPGNSTANASLSRTSDAPARPSLLDPDAAAGNAGPMADFPRLDALEPGLELVASSNAVGTTTEVVRTDRLPAGTYFVEVVGANGSTTVEPAALQLKVLEADQRPECSARALPARVNVPSAPATVPAEANTLVLVNPSRLEQLYPAQSGPNPVPSGRDTVQAALDELTTYLGNAGNQLGIVPVVVPVDAYAAVRNAYDHWDSAAGACDPEAANAVVAAINSSIIDPHRAQFDHIVVIGGDEVIPMARLADKTGVANEYDFRHELDGNLADNAGRNAASASFWESRILSDEPYGESSAQSLGDRFLYVSDAALGRLVETPSEIAASLRDFVTFRGTLAIDTAAVLGYDFLADGAAKVADAISRSGVANVDSDLADGFDSAGNAWDRVAAETKIDGLTGNALVSLNAHFDHYRALPAIGDKVEGFTDNLVAADLAPGAQLVQSLVFSMGCHSGFSASDILIGATNADWAQELSRRGSLLVGNTGFGYGDTKTVAYSERLMELFAQEVTQPLDLPSDAGTASSTVGQALTWAKNRYIAEIQTLSVYDEKALQESTFYGLPFYRVGLQPDPLPPAPTRRTAPDATGTPSIRTVVDTSNQPRLADNSLYFANTDSGDDQTIVAPGRPVQPKAVRDISVVSPTDSSVLGQEAVGAIVLGMTSTYQPVANPYIATPEFDQTREQAVSGAAVTFPSQPLSITTTTGPAGVRQQLAVATGQYQGDSRTQRLDDNIDVVVYYADATNEDHTLPTIGKVDSTVANGRLAISVTATDDSTAGVDRVYVLVAQNPGAAGSSWTGIDLQRVAGTDRWSGSLALAPSTTNVEFLVQAKDDAGNVGVASNKATNFADDLQTASGAPAAPPSALSVVAPQPPPTGAFSAPVTVQVTSSSPVTVTVDGNSTAYPAGPTSFVITGDGTHSWSVTTTTGYTSTGQVTIDTTAPTLRADRAPGVVPSPTVVKLYGTDAGAGVTRIEYQLTGPLGVTSGVAQADAVNLSLSLEGVNTIRAQAFDAAGNSSGITTFVFEVNGTPPVVTGTLSSPPNGAGWLRNAVLVTWTVDDPDATVPPPTFVNVEGANMRVTSGPSCDLAGNCSTGSVTLKIDFTAPKVALSTDRPPNDAGWNNTSVTVLATCGANDLSGFACPSPTRLDGDGANQIVRFSVIDGADNVTNVESRAVNIDRTAPTLSWNAPAAGSIVNLFTRPTCTASDATSGLNGPCVVEVSEPVLAPLPNSTVMGYNQYTATATVTDKAGNESRLTSTWKVKLDTNPPVIDVTASPAANNAGWWKSPVTFSFVCTDASPGVAVCPSPVTKSQQGSQSFTVTATDLLGNDNVMSLTANIDLTAPTLTVTAPTTVGPLDSVAITCTAADALSGIDFTASSCTSRTFPASQLDPGSNVFTFTAVDVAGNVTTVTKTITLVLPVNPAPVVRADMGVAGLEDVGFQSNIIVLTGSYADPSGPGPYTASVRWTANGPFTPLILAGDGSFVAAWLYGSAGTRTVTVRICDAGGACGTDTLTVRSGVTQRITPVRECVADRGVAANPRYQARWGYNNPATFAIVVPSIPLLENTFTSAPYLRGQPQIFLPGNQRGVFTTTFSSGTHTWKINGTSVSANSTSPRC